MKRILAVGSLAAALSLASACSGASGPAANTAGTNSNANRPAAPSNAANTAASPASSPAASTNTSSDTAASQGAAQDFSLVNSTGVEINALYISPHDADDWEEDILGRDTLPSGQTVEIKFNREEKAPMWDLRVEDKDGNAIVWENLNLLQISKLMLHYENGKATAEAQ